MKRILIVEDDAMIADNLSQIVEMLGYVALPTAHSYMSAVQLFDKYGPDLVTLDIELRLDQTGIDVAQYIREKGDTPFIFLTAQTGEGFKEQAAKTHPRAYLTKPFTIAEIKETLDGVFASDLKQSMYETNAYGA
ncbi:MAG: hypothetical protein Roseis2KO_45820 [Roseivirga sp.]